MMEMLLVAVVFYMLGELRAYNRVSGLQDKAIAAQKEALTSQKRAAWAQEKAEELIGIDARSAR